MKCDFCPDMARTGTLPYCVQGCPHNAIWYGDLEEDVASNGKDAIVFSRFLSENQAYHLREDLKTKPRVYYLPGHGEDVGRDAFKKGRLPTQWPWIKLTNGARKWKR
jgi:Fe-S-cluster-containing dehydrogenase component